MREFARITKLHNIAGRSDYISNPKRQEQIVCQSDKVDWKPYQEYEKNNRKSDKANNEGREVMTVLPNEWAKLPQEVLRDRCQQLAVTAAGKATDLQWSVHWNKSHTNLHMHVIFSERSREANPGRWDRNVYQSKDGGVARRKADRALNEDGSYVLLHQKGELKDGFTAKDPTYTRWDWIPNVKEQLKHEFEALGVDIEAPQPLHEYHEGKGPGAEHTRAKNEVIRANNDRIQKYVEQYPDTPERLIHKMAKDAFQDKSILYIHKDSTGFPYVLQISIEEYRQAKELEDLVQNLAIGSERAEDLRSQHDACSGFRPFKKKKLKDELEECLEHNAAIQSKIEDLQLQMAAWLPIDLDPEPEPEPESDPKSDPKPEPEQEPKQSIKELIAQAEAAKQNIENTNKYDGTDRER